MNGIQELVKFFKKIIDQKEFRWTVVFGVGTRGVALCDKLSKSGVVVDFFCDNNPANHGKRICNVPCISMDDLSLISDKSIVFVSPIDSFDIYKLLSNNHVQFVFPKELIDILYFLPSGERYLYPIGHYYSLYPDFGKIAVESERIFDKTRPVRDIDFNMERQLGLLNEMMIMYASLPQWGRVEDKYVTSDFRYRHGNSSLSSGDAVGLHCMLRILRPRRIVEVGSGYTSAVMMDTNEFFLNGDALISFVEPYPALINSLIKKTDNIDLHICGLEQMPLEFFEDLSDGDVLFIDSTHVSKVNSDVNYLFFEVMPRLKKGVYIHLHDIFYPFEYPKDWILEKGMVWNELYLLRAFLQNNKDYSIQFFQNMLEQTHAEEIREKWPLESSFHGGSIWLRKEV